MAGVELPEHTMASELLMSGLSSSYRPKPVPLGMFQGDSKPGLSYPTVVPCLTTCTELSSWSGSDVLLRIPAKGWLKPELVNLGEQRLVNIK